MSKAIPVSNKLGGAALMLVALLLLASGFWQWQHNREFATNAKRQNGTITSRLIDTSHHQTTPKVRYRYTVEGVLYEGGMTVDGADYGRLTEGATVPLVYLTESPGDSRIDLPAEIGEERNYPYMLVLIALPLFAFAALIYSLPSNTRDARNP
jgi:hypothetical protein